MRTRLPRHMDTRVRGGFLWFPKVACVPGENVRESRWLERAWWIEEFVDYLDGAWITRYWTVAPESAVTTEETPMASESIPHRETK